MKKKINYINESGIKYDSLKNLISCHFFNLIEYHDEIDYLNYIENFDFFEEKNNSPFEIKKIYLNIKEKLDITDKDKILKLKTSNLIFSYF